MLLADLRQLLETLGHGREAVASAQIGDYLNSLDERPWPNFGKGGRGLTAHALRRRLAPFGIKPERFSIDGVQVRGYRIARIREEADRYLPPLPGPPDEVSEASNCLDDPCRCPTNEPEGMAEAPARHIDASDTSQEGLEKGGGRGRIAPLAVGGERWVEWQERAGVLKFDAGMDREQAELRAADELRDASDDASS